MIINLTQRKKLYDLHMRILASSVRNLVSRQDADTICKLRLALEAWPEAQLSATNMQHANDLWRHYGKQE